MSKISKKQSIFFGFFAFFVFLLFWYGLSSSGLIKSLFLPAPHIVFYAIFELFWKFNLLQDVLASLYRIVSGFLLAVSLAIPLGLFIGVNKKVEAFLNL